jgi:hypothetical protein
MAQNDPLEKLANTGLLKHEPPVREEIAGLLRTAAVRLEDARKRTNAPESRFDLAYNAAHAKDETEDRRIVHESPSSKTPFARVVAAE